MVLQTRNFGELNVNDDKILSFPIALPGFPNVKEFALIHKQDIEGNEIRTFAYLQSIGTLDVTLPLIDLSFFLSDYTLDLDDNALALIGGYSPEHSLIYNIMVVPEKLEDARTNLQAPIVINLDTKMAIQICMKGEYDIRYPLHRFLKEKEANMHVGSN